MVRDELGTVYDRTTGQRDPTTCFHQFGSTAGTCSHATKR